MSQPVPSQTRDFARRLLTHETAVSRGASQDGLPAAFRVAEKLRRPLITLAGAAGFRSLLSRALTLAKTDSHSLRAVSVKPDGSLDGLKELDGAEAVEAGAMLIAQLLGLLITFIGEPLTVQLVRYVWPDLPDDADSGEQNR